MLPKSVNHFRFMDLNTWHLISPKINIMIFVCFVFLRPKSTAIVMKGWSVHLTTLFS